MNKSSNAEKGYRGRKMYYFKHILQLRQQV